MAFIVTMNNAGGELDRRTAKDGIDAAAVLIEMLKDTELAHGDSFAIVDEDELDG